MHTKESASTSTVSIVTPNLNYGHYLGKTIDSIVSQGYQQLDYIVVDGGSNDQSIDVTRSFADRGVQLLIEPGLGQYDAINLGFAKSSGEIMGWTNSDDIQFSWTLSTVVAIFEQFPDVHWIMGAPAVIQEGAVQCVKPVRPHLQEAIHLGIYSGRSWGIIQQESCFWRRSLWEAAGPLNPSFELAADFELWTRFARETELVTCDALLSGFHRHTQNRSKSAADHYRSDLAKFVASLSDEEQDRRNHLEKWAGTYHRAKHLPGIKRIVRTLSGLQNHDGPIIRRDFNESRFQLSRELIFP